MVEVHVRQGTVEDADGVGRVHAHTWQVAYRGQVADEILDGMSGERSAARWRESFAEGSIGEKELFVAEVGGEIVGFINVGTCRDPDVDEAVGEVRAIYVDPNCWDTGVGAALMRTGLEALRATYREVALWVLECNERGRCFYERGGWTFDGTRQRLESLGLDEVRYRISLKEG